MLGKLLGDRYLLQEQLGNEIGRKTFLALDKLASDSAYNSVVVKLLSLGNNFSWQHLKLFTREADTLKQLNHPAIPRYLDYLEINEPDFKGFVLVQTYIAAENLEQNLKAGRTFSEIEVTQIARALLDTLIYLQAQEPAIMHRDIKPSNILLANRSGNKVGDVYLVDFGSVQHLAAQEGGTITVVGTYGYMPPEQFGGRTNPASDLYSLGATLIYLTTGRHPTELPQENLQIQFQSFANLSPAFSDWLAWLTEPSLEQRLPTAAQALEALNNQQIRPSKPHQITPSTSESEALNKVATKPKYTNISCCKNTKYIEITIPTPGLEFALLGLAIFIFSFSLLALDYYKYSKTYEYNFFPSTLEILVAFVVFITCTLAILYVIFSGIFSWFGKTKLRIDCNRISLKKELWGFKRNLLPPSNTKSIKSLHKFPVKCITNTAGDIMVSATKLEIITVTHKYFLRSNSNISPEEIDWIAAEISEWLDLSIDSDSIFLN